MFSKTTEYAFRASVFLCEAKGRRVPAQEIAAATHVPVRYMSKVLQTLTEAGLIESQRGPSGGFWMTRDPATMSLLDVVQAIAPFERVGTRSYGTDPLQDGMVALHRELDNLTTIAIDKLASISLDSLMGESDDAMAVEAAVANGSSHNGSGHNGTTHNGAGSNGFEAQSSQSNGHHNH